MPELWKEGEVGMTREEAAEILEEVKVLDDSMFAYSQAYNDALDMAIEVLKAQEPRVMTISDFKDEGVYYLEALPPFVLRPVIYRLDHSDPRHYNFVWKYDQFTWNTDEYGKTWRCWTFRPTDEQREAAKWE